MKTAFEILGLPSWHWVTMATNPPDMLMWEQALSAKFTPKNASEKPFGLQEFDHLLGHWAAVTDLPAALFANELVTAYPDAKVVLIERDVEKWYKSFSEAIISSVQPGYMVIVEKLDPIFFGQMARLNDLITKHYFDVDQPRTNGLISNRKHFAAWRANAKAAYQAHNEMVKRVTPSDRLLLFQLEDGWEPLCEFLGKPVPGVPFPRVNETAALQEKIVLYVMEGCRRGAVRRAKQALPIALPVLAIVIWWKLML